MDDKAHSSRLSLGSNVAESSVAQGPRRSILSYTCALFVAFLFVPIVAFSTFELAARNQGIDFLRYELSRAREKIVESSSPLTPLASEGSSGASVSAAQIQKRTADLALETILEDSMRRISELAIKGAENNQSTVHALIQDAFDAKKLRSDDRSRILSTELQRELAADLQNEIEKKKQRKTDCRNKETHSLSSRSFFL